jgi:predicted nucleotidyltransferase
MNSRRAGVFTVDERTRIHDRILELAKSDERIVAGAVVGSLATNEGDRWSDLDLTFGVTPENQTLDVLDRLTTPLASEFGAVHLFDLPHRESLFRVLLLQGCLQVDLSVTPASKFGPNGPKFRMLFGSYTENPPIPAPRASELIGYAAHHAVRARFCIERGRFWQAEYWISGARDYALSLACLRHNLSPHYGRGFDQLPAEIQARAKDALVRSLDRAELQRALASVVEELLKQAHQLTGNPAAIEPHLLLLTTRWSE